MFSVTIFLSLTSAFFHCPGNKLLLIPVVWTGLHSVSDISVVFTPVPTHGHSPRYHLHKFGQYEETTQAEVGHLRQSNKHHTSCSVLFRFPYTQFKEVDSLKHQNKITYFTLGVDPGALVFKCRFKKHFRFTCSSTIQSTS
jgi:hypothetical protein